MEMLQLRILITTPKSYARSTEQKLRPFIVGKNAACHTIMVNADDTQILWIVDCQDSRRMLKIQKNVLQFDFVMKKVLENKVLRKFAKLSKEDEEQLNTMLLNQTQVCLVNHSVAPERLDGFSKVE
jgi:hypothetical protein